jgi:Mg-chelatase subunit ChlD
MSNLPENFICPITQQIMTDPVMCEDGISYERTAIMRWLETNNTSPVTRATISQNIIPNIALRNTIQDYMKQTIQQTQISQQTQLPSISNTVNITNFTNSQSVCQYNGDYYSMLTLNFTNTTKKNNIIVAVVDTSGSMGENADIPGTESSGLSRLDLVKHTLNTFTHALSDGDMMCIIKFSNHASVVSDFIKLNRHGKDIVSENIKSLHPDGMTNLWAGIKLGINKIESIYNDSYNISMIVMTDGMSNSDPPRGIVPTLQEQITSKKLNFSINTFGYGYNIDSSLLCKIADISHGIFGFIPDATMVGTTFINMIASIVNGSINNLEIKPVDNFVMCTPHNFGMISTNQPVHIIFKSNQPLNSDIEIKFNGVDHQINFNANIMDISKQQIEQFMRLELYNIINRTLVSQNSTDLMNFQNQLIVQNRKYNSKYISDLIHDIVFDDPNKGQLTKAVEKRTWFEQWGTHYLKAIGRAHQLERCITFKELSPQHYNSDEFKLEQSRIEQIFCDLPAPTPSNTQVSYTKGYSQSQSQSQNYTPVSMSTYYVQDGGCFDGSSKVKMFNVETKEYYYKSVDEIRSGDTVYSPFNNDKFAQVVCVLKLKMNKKITMCNINDMRITPYHPIFINDEWKFPIDISEPYINEIDYVYDFVLDSGHIIEINGIDVITLAHGFDFNEIVRHEYFGDKIIDDLMTHPDWIIGYIQLDNYSFVRDDDMRIVGLKYE